MRIHCATRCSCDFLFYYPSLYALFIFHWKLKLCDPGKLAQFLKLLTHSFNYLFMYLCISSIIYLFVISFIRYFIYYAFYFFIFLFVHICTHLFASLFKGIRNDDLYLFALVYRLHEWMRYFIYLIIHLLVRVNCIAKVDFNLSGNFLDKLFFLLT